jgi:hypothetical protein
VTVANSHYQNVSMHSARIDEDQGTFYLEWEIPEDFRLGVAKLKFTQMVRHSPVCLVWSGLVSSSLISHHVVACLLTERRYLLSCPPAHLGTVRAQPHRGASTQRRHSALQVLSVSRLDSVCIIMLNTACCDHTYRNPEYELDAKVLGAGPHICGESLNVQAEAKYAHVPRRFRLCS